MSKPPAITQKVAVRAILCLFLIALLFAGYHVLMNWHDPFNDGIYDSRGLILAIQSRSGGSQAVIVKPDGQILESPDYKAGKTDQDAVWRPDGNVVLFSSDREAEVFNLYRWNLMKRMVQRRSLGTRGQLATYFGPTSLGANNDSALITAGGFVEEFKAVDGTTLQVLPPIPRGASSVQESGGESGVGSQFDSAYQNLGSSFRVAKWGKNKDWVVAVMRGEEGEVLIVQNMTRLEPPIKIVNGGRIDFEINPQSGVVVFTVQQLMLEPPDPRAVPKGRLEAARKARAMQLANPNRIGTIDPDALASGTPASQNPWIGAGKANQAAFGSPAISPDGSTLLVVVGPYKEGTGLEPRALVAITLGSGGSAARRTIAEGVIRDPAWGPDGDSIVYVKQVGAERALCTNSSTGGDEKILTQGKGDFSHPTFSPQIKSP